jgi:hypothetical protein
MLLRSESLVITKGDPGLRVVFVVGSLPPLHTLSFDGDDLFPLKMELVEFL